MLGFKIFHATELKLASIEVMAIIKKEQMKKPVGNEKTSAKMFYGLAS